LQRGKKGERKGKERRELAKKVLATLDWRGRAAVEAGLGGR
jgi:hypothetical protein